MSFTKAGNQKGKYPLCWPYSTSRIAVTINDTLVNSKKGNKQTNTHTHTNKQTNRHTVPMQCRWKP